MLSHMSVGNFIIGNLGLQEDIQGYSGRTVAVPEAA
jgi:hypothetical protein